MKPCIPLMAILFATFPLAAQQPAAPGQPASPPAAQQTPETQQTPQAAEPAPPSSSAPDTTGPMSPMKGELVGKLDSKEAKVGDEVVVKTRDTVKTPDGTEIPKGSKLMGHIIATHPSEGGANSQVALEFDHLELKGGQSLPVHSQIQSIAPAEGDASASNAGPGNMGPGPISSAPTGSAPTGSPSAGSMSHSSSPGMATPSSSASPNAAPAASGVPQAGTVVAKNGNIAIQTTSIPGVLLANNAPGVQDPRMAKASSILLGAKQDIKLDSGTKVVVGISAAHAGQ